MTIYRKKYLRKIKDEAEQLTDEGKHVKISYEKLTGDGSVWRWDRVEKAIKR